MAIKTIIRRRGSRDAAMLPAAERAGLLETAYLLRSPKNASRLLTALRRAGKGQGKRASLAQVRREIGLGGDPNP